MRNQPLGARMSGPTYEPQVTPYDRDDDTVAVNQSSSHRRSYDSAPYDNNDYARRRDEPSGRSREGDIWNRRDLVPEYGMSRGERVQGRPWDGYRSRQRETPPAPHDDREPYRQPWAGYLKRDIRGW